MFRGIVDFVRSPRKDCVPRLARGPVAQSLRSGALALAISGTLIHPAFAAQPVSHSVKAATTPKSSSGPQHNPVSVPAATNQPPKPNTGNTGQTVTIPASASASAAQTDAHCPSFTIDSNGVVTRSLAVCSQAPATHAPVSAPVSAPASSPLSAPYHSQFDGSVYAETDCGPTSLSMALGALKINVGQLTLRNLANVQMGTTDPNNGTSWAALAYAAQKSGATASGFSQGKGDRVWTLADLKAELSQGHPVMLLVRYQDLPGHAQSSFTGDHYIVGLRFDANGNLVYNDPAFTTASAGANRTMSPTVLNQAWSNTAEGVVRSAMAVSK